MTNRTQYNGSVIEPVTRFKGESHGWTLEVHITPTGRPTGLRRCRAPNTYPSEKMAIAYCLEFGRPHRGREAATEKARVIGGSLPDPIQASSIDVSKVRYVQPI